MPIKFEKVSIGRHCESFDSAGIELAGPEYLDKPDTDFIEGSRCPRQSEV